MPKARKVLRTKAGVRLRSEDDRREAEETVSRYEEKGRLNALPKCGHCGERFFSVARHCSGGGRKGKYCGAACRKAASRKRKAEEAAGKLPDDVTN